MKNPNKNKLPRKRKKLFKRCNAVGSYLMTRILNEILFEETGKKPRFPKVKQNADNPRKIDIVGYW